MVGTGSSMGAVGKGYAGGWAGSLYGIGGALGILVAAWLFAPVRKHCFMTMAEELASYVGANRTVLNLVAVFTFMASVGWLGAHIVGGGAYLHYATGINESWARASIALGFGIYAMIGGYRAVVWTDTLQAVVLFIGFFANCRSRARNRRRMGWSAGDQCRTTSKTRQHICPTPFVPHHRHCGGCPWNPQPSANAYIQESRFQTFERHMSLLQACILHSLRFPQLLG